jgi:hypothetical protein
MIHITNDKKGKSQSFEAVITIDGQSTTGYGYDEKDALFDLKLALLNTHGKIQAALDEVNEAL